MKVYIGRSPGPKSKKKEAAVRVRIDPWDTWSMDHTLAPIILPMLIQMKSTNHGAPLVDDADVPEHLKSTSAQLKEHDWDVDEFHFDRWFWVMSEMIFAFESKLADDYIGRFTTKNPDYVPNVDNTNFMDQYKYDWAAIKEIEARMQNGFVLFGKYFQALWD